MFTPELKKKLEELKDELKKNGVSLIAHAAYYTADDLDCTTIISTVEIPEAPVDHQICDAYTKIGVEWFNIRHDSTLCFRPGKYENRTKE